MPDCLTASVLFRAYIRRKPSGLLLVTVLSAALPRPLFRMYPAELGEAAAVERSVGHALETLHQRAPDKCEQRDKSRFNAVFAAPDEAPEDDSNKSNRQSHALLPAVNVVAAEPLHRSLPCSAEQGDKRNDEGNKQCDSESCEKLKRLELNPQIKGFHLSPHGLHQTSTDAAVRSEEQEGVEGYAVNGGHLVAPIEICSNDSKEEFQPSGTNINPCYGKRDAKSCAESSLKYSEFAVTNKPIKGLSEPTQHLRLRVVWQGLLPLTGGQPSCAVGSDRQKATI